MPADISFTPGADGAITARIAPGTDDGARRLLEDHDAVREPGGDTWTFTGPNAVARAARAAYLLNAGELHVETHTGPVAREHTVAPVDGADVVFARHPTDGIVAATATDSTEGLVPDVLRRFGFGHDGSAPDRDIYLPPAGQSEREALVSAARASLVLQGLGFQVATRGLATPPASADRLAEAAEDLAVEQVNLRSITDSRDIADLLDAAVDERSGAMHHLTGLLEDIGEWATALPAGAGRQIRGRINEVRVASSELLADLSDLQRELVDLDAVVDAPATSLRSARAAAATAAGARGPSTGPILQASGVAPAAAPVPQAASHTASL
ncbi:hypothetical protein ACFVH7_12460 [Kitasatospora indigofera]|uniref:hypothetical protein n=1 Tax=Kitasatospora indigofera TaxID=67307 RepID=UPI00362B8A72